MDIYIIFFIFGIILGLLIAYFIIININRKQFNHLKMKAEIKAKEITSNANLYSKNLKEEMDNDKKRLEKELTQFAKKKEENKNNLEKKSILFKEKTKEAENSKIDFDKKNLYLKEIIDKKLLEIDKLTYELSQVANLTENEAKDKLFSNLEHKLKLDFAIKIRKYEKNAKEEGEKKANYILSQAVTRYAGTFANEQLINTIQLKNDDDKGRIIGKKGRNIKSLENLLGVDILVDETPGLIIISNFNLYRRSIAVETLKKLIKDGRIHPGKIEEIYEKVKSQFEDNIFKDGENILIELKLYPMHEKLTRLIGRLRYRTSYGQNALKHTLEVARLAHAMAIEMGGDEKLALRAGLLHDIGKALTQDLEGNHIDLGVEICTECGEHPTVINAIYAHHGLREPDGVESAAVCAADVLSASRPGARNEVLNTFIKRVKSIEDIALKYDGVVDAYAINAGREIRVFIDPIKISDNEMNIMARDITKEIELKIQFPGEVKINIIREKREIIYARQSLK